MASVISQALRRSIVEDAVDKDMFDPQKVSPEDSITHLISNKTYTYMYDLDAEIQLISSRIKQVRRRHTEG